MNVAPTAAARLNVQQATTASRDRPSLFLAQLAHIQTPRSSKKSASAQIALKTITVLTLLQRWYKTRTNAKMALSAHLSQCIRATRSVLLAISAHKLKMTRLHAIQSVATHNQANIKMRRVKTIASTALGATSATRLVQLAVSLRMMLPPTTVRIGALMVNAKSTATTVITHTKTAPAPVLTASSAPRATTVPRLRVIAHLRS